MGHPDVHESAAAALERASADVRGLHALVGFDGFIDAIIEVVDRRRSMGPGDYERVRTIAGFAERVAGAAGRSTNLEMVVTEERFGGNGPLMAAGLARLGMPTTFVGAVGMEENPAQLHPLYGELARRCARVVPIAPPAHTDALEFDDGKLMLGRPANVQRVTWGAIKDRMGLGAIVDLVDRSALIGIVNWVMMAGVEGIWDGLCDEVLPIVTARPRRVYIDLCDPAKRTDADLRGALAHLARMNGLAPVTLGLNLAEGERLAGALGLARFEARGEAVRSAAEAIRGACGLDCVVIHPREGAAAADADGSAWVDGPFTPTPRLSTGAGDHFNAGFALAQVLRMGLGECLAVGAATSGAYVRDAASPDVARVLGMLRQPAPRGGR
ncbi:MAG: carbohydrate kinase family protein [Phycisphaerae bacterium]|nr:carbohydrate kinase family protein [Phycisphaerae bacterium]